MTPALDAEVRRADEDRWLASRFAPADVRARLIAVYALNHEIARTADVVTQAAIGDIRLAWWREALAEMFDGKPVRAHPVLAAVAQAHSETPFSRETLDALIDARGKDLDTAPFASATEIDAYLDATAGSVMRLAVQACGGGGSERFVEPAARAWGYAGLLRAAAHWRAKGRTVLPQDNHDPHAMLARARAAFAAARACASSMPSSLFPAVGYAALTPLYLRALERGANEVGLLRRQMKLVAASATGRL